MHVVKIVDLRDVSRRLVWRTASVAFGAAAAQPSGPACRRVQSAVIGQKHFIPVG